MKMAVTLEREIGGKTLTIETGKLAKQAHGSAVVRFGETMCLGTVVRGPARPGQDFFPLTVDYRERMSAAGRFPGGFFKREGRPTDKEILTCRMIDRPIRPLFPEGFIDEVLIQVMVLSADLENEADVVGMISAAAALAVSPLPFEGPVAVVRIGRIDGKLVINPTRSQLEYADMEMILGGHLDGVNMIEVGSREVSEEVVADAIEFGHKQGVVPICQMLAELRKQAGKPVDWVAPEVDKSLLQAVQKKASASMKKAKAIKGKQERNEAVKAIYDEILESYLPGEPDETPEFDEKQVRSALQAVEQEIVRTRILKEGVRPDGRKPDELRSITCEVGLLPRTHGSSLFCRGETQSLVSCTLGTGRDEQTVDEMAGEYNKKFMLHYNFPPFSVGEVRRITGPGRREIGHGALAERSLLATLPPVEDFPYTIRIVSDILESNGSSSMASVCGGTLALMDAGVPISAPVAGISVGMVEEKGKYELLTDILGEEDHFGDMDFKVAGTRKGITGIQLDLKTRGLSYEIVRESLKRTRTARMKILDLMEATIAAPRPEISARAPRLISIKIHPEKIGKLIGPGGKSIKALQADTGAQIDIEEDGTVLIAAPDGEAAQRAKEAVERITEDVQIGRIYEGRVSSIRDFGAFIEIVEGQDGLCHISELDEAYVRAVTDVVKVGDVVRVKVINIDDQGRVKLSRKAAMIEEGTRSTAAVGGGGGDDEDVGDSGGEENFNSIDRELPPRDNRPPREHGRDRGRGGHGRGDRGGRGGGGGGRDRGRGDRGR